MAANYDFQTLLSPNDFEILIRDLLSRELEIELRAFSEGADQGVDLRYSIDPSNTTVVQCKRTKSITEKKLELEARKVAKLAVVNYYLAISSELSLKKTDQILRVFSRWVKHDGHIYSKGRINGLLDKYPEALRENYKLWIGSSEIFDQFINNDLLGRSKFLKEDIAKSIKYFVKNDGYSYAADILDQNNLVIISGIPGIGKTTLAKILIWEYLKQGYEIIEIRSVNEGENILREGDRHKQILYFDDFLGENFLAFDVLQGRSNDLYMFMKRFAERNAKSKKLIMTTREYILNQAFVKYEKLNAQDLNVNKYILDLTKYSINSKALILYNHLYYSNLPMEYIRNILTDNNYEKIIYHRNYSPRIIEAMTIKVGDLRSNEYTKEFLNSLDNPLRIWGHAFESQISEAAQYLLYLLVSFGTDILVKDLEIAFRDFTTKAGLISQLQTNHNSFRNHLKEIQIFSLTELVKTPKY